jgi:hypothetical protein
VIWFQFLCQRRYHRITGEPKVRFAMLSSRCVLTNESIAPVRLSCFFALTGYSYAFSAGSLLQGTSAYKQSSWGEGLKNRVVFTWAFLELITWFWIFLTLREERREMVQRIMAKRAAEEDMM